MFSKAANKSAEHNTNMKINLINNDRSGWPEVAPRSVWSRITGISLITLNKYYVLGALEGTRLPNNQLLHTKRQIEAAFCRRKAKVAK